MISSFNFPRSVSEDKRLWDILNQNTVLKAFTPICSADFTGTEPTILQGYYQLYGPMVFIFIHLQSSGSFGWNSGLTIDIPIGPYIPRRGTFPQVLNPVTNVTTSLAVNTEHPAITPGPRLNGRIVLMTAVSDVDGPTEVVLSGFYLRNSTKRQIADSCRDTYGAGWSVAFFDDFNTDGNLNGASAEISPNNSWTYADFFGIVAVRSGGSVTPASFTASGDTINMYKALVSVNLSGEDTERINFFGPDYTLSVKLQLGSGQLCSFSFQKDGSEEIITDTFSIGFPPNYEVTFGIDGYRTAVEGGYEMYLYLGPDLTTTPVATLVQGIDPFPTYTPINSFELWNNSFAGKVNFIRICSYSGV